jgi:iron complex transport system substrate-binding protein
LNVTSPPPVSARRSASGLRNALRVAALLWVTVLVTNVHAQVQVLRDDRGQEHRLPAPPQRIVSMMPSLTESLWRLGVGARLVGVDRYSDWPADIARLPRLGGLDDANIEAIVALKPDIVLASISSRTMDRLEQLGVRVMRFKSDTHADLQRTLTTLGQVLGDPQRGSAVWAQVQRDIASAAGRVPPRLRGKTIYFEVGGGPYAAGTSSFIGETLTLLGMSHVVPAALGPFPKLNPEFVVRAKPEIIMGLAREQAALLQRPGWSAIPAVRDRRLCGFNAAQYDMLVRPGPRLGEAAGLVADCLVRLNPADAQASASR